MTSPPSSNQENDLRARVERALAPAYVLGEEIGRGGAGIVYRAEDVRLKRSVAVKILPPDLAFRADVRDRFMREAETSARLAHPHIVPIYTVDEKEGLAFFIMGLVDGENLGDRVRVQGPLPIPEIRRVMREVAEALDYAHGRGVVHRDIKPDNILIAFESGRAMVTDFGIARAASEGGTRLTATGTAIGTPAYMSPEQCAGDRELDGRSDLYSLGAVAYYMLVGKPPFDGPTTPVVMMKQVTEAPVPIDRLRRDVPADLQRIVMNLLEKDPNRRFGEGRELIAALDGAPVAEEYAAPSRYPTLRTSVPSLADTLGAFKMPPRAPFVPIAPMPHLDLAAGEIMSRHEARQRRRMEKRQWKDERENARPLPDRIRSFRKHMVSYVGTTLFLFGINAVTGGSDPFWWAIFPAMGMGMGLMTEGGSLWAAGARLKDVFGSTLPRQPAQPDESTIPSGSAGRAGEALPAGVSAEVLASPRGPTLRQAVADRQTVHNLISNLSDAERKLLPDVAETADNLHERIVALAAALHRIDGEIVPGRLASLDERIAKIEQGGDGAGDQERLLRLLKRQREMLANMIESRHSLSEQYESAGLLLQNLTLDLLKMRSSGLQSALNDVTSVTQEARALSREIGYVLAAADELRDIDGRS
ncbi:MAG TPA: protein kinase [Gemmatimonadaceae bacterium]|nr:protein kinase [Gemmatimonadaceae bacterium]